GNCSGERSAAWHEDDLPILEYGTSFSGDQWVCSSSKTGMTCWNTKTYHGFKLSRSAQLTW
ncbi:MAG: hypothetical protein LBU38_01690, partial [Propionibacteriaceae bacterium]|nr:hypothetical protein [Propionibacteriaceae bacterium]